MKKRIFWVLFFLYFLNLFNFTLAVSQAPEYINVGLDYGEDALPEVELYFDQGFSLSYKGQEIFAAGQKSGIKAVLVNGLYTELASGFSDFYQAQNYINDHGLTYLGSWPAFVGDSWSVWLSQEGSSALGWEFSNVRFDACLFFYDSWGNELFFFQPSMHSAPNILKDHGAVFSDLGGGFIYYGPNLRAYPHQMILQRFDAQGITVINRLLFEDYIAAVISREMSPSWPLEALKAQAVASRSFILATQYDKIPYYLEYGFDINTTQQTYIGFDLAQNGIIEEAVAQTQGEVARFTNNKGEAEIIAAYFHADAGGATENCENVFFQALPYIRGTMELYETESPDYAWEKEMSNQDFREALIDLYGDPGEILAVRQIKSGAHGALLEAEIEGSRKNLYLSNHQLRDLFELKSYRFTIKKPVDLYFISAQARSVQEERGLTPIISRDGKTSLPLNQNSRIISAHGQNSFLEKPDNLIINGGGYGHNLVLSQHGAKTMADQGHDYREIIEFYFKGVWISP